MVLVVNVGNTSVTLGCFAGEQLRLLSRLTTEQNRSEDQYAVELQSVLRLNGVDAETIDGSILSSVVPPLTQPIARAVEKITGVRPLLVGPGIKTGLNIKIDDPATLGADIVAACVAALRRYPLPCIVVDLGTATSFSVLNEKGVMVGGAILPGITLALDALYRSAALLTHVALRTPQKVIATNTADSMVAGSVAGAAAMLDGMTLRMEEELGAPCSVVCTGEAAEWVLPLCRRPMRYDKTLLLDGLRLLFEKNSAPKQAQPV